ncbi:hypothetical protein D3C78_1397180 [compost metagenome]
MALAPMSMMPTGLSAVCNSGMQASTARPSAWAPTSTTLVIMPASVSALTRPLTLSVRAALSSTS